MIMLAVPLHGSMCRCGWQRARVEDAVPFPQVYIHALVRDADPAEDVETRANVLDRSHHHAFGTDAVRFTLASMASRERTSRSVSRGLKGTGRLRKQDINARASSHAGGSREGGGLHDVYGHGGPVAELQETPLETRWIFGRLSAVCAEVDRALGSIASMRRRRRCISSSGRVSTTWYLELVKLRMEFGEARTQCGDGGIAGFAGDGAGARCSASPSASADPSAHALQ